MFGKSFNPLFGRLFHIELSTLVPEYRQPVILDFFTLRVHPGTKSPLRPQCVL
jgi:hypothetical protein